MRAPYMMAESTSRPWSSVPSANNGSPSSAQAGGLKASPRLSVARSKGLCGAIHGASSAPMMQTSATTAEATVTGERLNDHQMSLSKARARAEAISVPPGRAAADPQPRIDEEVEQVDHQVDADEDQRDEHEIGRHDGNVRGADRLDEQQPHARPLEHRLRHDGEGDDAAELQPGDGDDRHQRILQRMAEIDGAVAEATGAGELDVVGPQHLQHLRPHQPHDERELEEAKRDRGQNQRLEARPGQESGTPPAQLDDVAPAEAGQPAQPDGEDQDQQDADQEGRQRDADQAEGEEGA